MLSKFDFKELNYNLWLVGDDNFYYKNSREIFNFQKDVELLILPSEEEICKTISKISSNEKIIVVLTTTYPNFKFKNFFVTKTLPATNEFLTIQQTNAGMTNAQALQERLGISVIESPFGLKDVGGAYGLKEYAKNLIEAEKEGYVCKGIFLVGVPGTGKTFFPKCFSGELGRPLIQLNLSEIMESDNPIGKLNSIFEFLTIRHQSYPNSKYVILIDEIEKMIGNSSAQEKQMLGRLLTILNDIHTPASEYEFNAIFFATANSLETILDNNPEFLRRGRWNELFFINLPEENFAKDIFKIYIKKKNLENIIGEVDTDDKISLETLVTDINLIWGEYSIGGRFPYTAAEIENFCDRLSFFIISKKENFDKNKDLQQCIKDIIPVAKTAEKAIKKMIAQKDLFIEI